ncbi:MAG: hypothetical protein LBC90_00800 [Candidatus Adiutrix sp.]|jgi:OOP family OmpA-OmpF porin|nr:hypothetical protein [Candidatus Adiutrix sp.]
MSIIKWQAGPVAERAEVQGSVPAAVAPDPSKAPASPDDLEARLLAQVAAITPAAGRPPETPSPAPPPSSPPASARVYGAPDPGGDDAEMARLRHLLLGREIDGLARLWEKVDDPELLARTLSPVVTEALFLRTQADQKLDTVLSATVERILRGSVRRNPAELADNLFPVMGPAIRRSIAESLRGMLQDFNRLVEKSFSLSGLKWRLTALRTGRSFSEVALLNSLEYQVEQVFFVHTRTGTALIHLVHENVQARDASGDQVAAMFTALQQFVSDSFAEGELNDLTFGDVHICVVQGPEVYLACVVRGQAPPGLRQDMRTLLELLIVDLADELDDFRGDLEPFQKCRHFLEGLLVSRLKDEGRKLPLSAFLLPALIAALVLGPIIHLGYQSRQGRLKAEAEEALQRGYAALEKRLYDEAVGPGLSPVHIGRRPDGIWELTFLKDEMADGPGEKLAALGLDEALVRLTYLPYLSQDPELVERRAAQVLADRPETLEYDFDWNESLLTLRGRADLNWVLTVHDTLRSMPGLRAILIKDLTDEETGVLANLDRDNALRLSGQASLAWRETLKERALALSGISRLDLSQLEDDAESRRIKELLAALGGVIIHFPVGGDQPIPEDRDLLDRAVEDLVALEKLAEPMGLAVSLTIYGYTDLSGQVKRNYELSQARARTLAALLYERGSAIALSTFGLGPDPAEEEAGGRQTPDQKKAAAQASRRIELKVRLDRTRVTLNLD